ncbi:glycosyltransferase family 2 protein [Paracoccus sp. p3-h83]|uniref:glycosyltransferase family 2 protein n=1 Tax=Paracoccus sp. p3-h83 TaxID=3342805 RepID=UPI0035B8C593
MTDPLPLLRRTLRTIDLARHCPGAGLAGHVMDVLPIGAGLARIYLNPGFAAEAMPAAGAGDVVAARMIAGSPAIDLRIAPGADHVTLPGCDAPLPITAGEGALFAGRNVLIGHCNDEPPAVIRDWLLWHRDHHRAEGAVIIDRSPPGGTDALTAALAPLWSQAIADDPSVADMRVVLVDCDLPLGLPGHGPEAHPIYAPDAPGKDRMTAPDPQPWRARLAYPLLFDLIRHRWLAQARAVANLELFDLIPEPADGFSIFDRAHEVPGGVVPLLGERAYPWGLRKGADAGFGDHICHRFDGRPHDWRWCAAPDRLPEGTFWVMQRILGSRPVVAPEPFWRFMAIRHGDGGKVSQIVPKTSLVESPDLLAIADAFGARPLRQPAGAQAAPAPAPAPRGNRVCIVTTMKNEGPFILEWIAYHRAIGVQDFLIYTNDCTDGTDSFLQLLADKGICTWRDNPYRDSGMKPQHAALDAANDEAIVKAADWLICMDVDEYIAIHTGDGTLAALFDAVPAANMISLTWRLFGNNDIDAFTDGLITQDFTRCAREFANKPHQAWGFKTLYRNIGLFRKMGVHRPKGLLPSSVGRINWVNGSGKAMPEKEWRTAWRSHSGTYGYDLVSLNHYAVRSTESFLVKRDRGRVNHVERDQGMAYWFRMNHNVVQDARLHRMRPAIEAEMARLMADPDIAAAHHGCVAAHAAKIAELKQQPKYEEFHQELNSDRMRKLARLHGHFGSGVYLAGPEVIPDEVLAHDPEDEFFFTVDHVGETQH